MNFFSTRAYGSSGSSPRVGDIPAPRFGEDTRAYMKHIDDSVDAFYEDVVRDVCQFGSVITDAYGTPIAPETFGYPAWNASICKTRGAPLPPLAGQKPHSTSEWLRAFSLWKTDWSNYEGKNFVDLPGGRPDRAQLDTWYAQLEGANGWREQFIKNGGMTITPVAPKPKETNIPWTAILVVGGLAAAALLLRSIPFTR